MRMPLSKSLPLCAFYARKWLVKLARIPFRRVDRRSSPTPESIAALRQEFSDQIAAAHNIGPSRFDNVPKQIFILWQQGWDSAPDLVKMCAQSWERENPDWTVHRISERDIKRFAPDYADLDKPDGPSANRANLARFAILSHAGGVWVDSTTYCHRPLNDWLPDAMPSGFFAFSKPRPYREIEIWFLASEPDHHISASLWNWARDYWETFPIGLDYYWLEYGFEHLLKTQPELANYWNQTAKVRAAIVLMFSRHAFNPHAPFALAELDAPQFAPLSKLSYKWDMRKMNDDTPLAYLMSSAVGR